MATPNRRKKCAYCGSSRPKTRDHVIPRSLFIKTPPNMITVPACEACNSRKAHFDTYLRDTLVTDIAGSQHPTAQAIWSGALVSSIRRNQSAMMREFITNSTAVPLSTPSGIIVGSAAMAIAPADTFDKIFNYLVRGLYYYIERRVLSKNRAMKVIRLVGSGHEVAHGIFRKHGALRVIQLGDAVFRCKYQRSSDDPYYTVWFLSFFRGVNYFITTPRQVCVPKILQRDSVNERGD